MLNKTNRKLIVGSEKLFTSNNLAYEFGKDHDIFLYSYDQNKDVTYNSRMIWRDLKPYLVKSYDHITFMGHGMDANVVYDLHMERRLDFDAIVTVNHLLPVSVDNWEKVHDELLQTASKRYSFSYGTNTKRPVIIFDNHQSLPFFTTLRSRRLAQEIYGCVVYGAYEQTHLVGSNTEFIH